MSMLESESGNVHSDSNTSREESNDIKLMSDQIIEAVEELSLDVADIQKATEETLCLDDAGRQSIAAFASTAEHIKEIIHQTLKCRQEQPIDTEVISTGEAGIQEKIAALKMAIENSAEEEASSRDNKPEPSSDGKASKDQSLLQEPAQAQASTLTTIDDAISVCQPEITPEVTPDSREESSKTNTSTTTTKTVTAPPTEEKASKSNQKHKKGEKTAEQILKSLSHLPNSEEKLRQLSSKHVETLEEVRNLEGRLRQADKQMSQLAREKEHLQGEHNRSVLARSRLESLCRELQRQNKMIKDESLLRIREEEEKRKEISNKFQGTLTDITTLLQENKRRDAQLREENLQLADKLKALVDHYDTWEKHMEKVLQQKDLEAQLNKAKLGKALLQHQGDREQSLLEKQQLLENMSSMQKKGAQLAKTELQLRTELAVYTAKYEEFQGVLSKSNQVFANFKVDMEKMSKKIKGLEKETVQWKSKWESSNRALIDMATDKQKRDKELIASNQRIATLEKLCRALQAERNNLQISGKTELPQTDSSENVSSTNVPTTNGNDDVE